MEKRFNDYLDKKFSKLPKTKDVKEFREELLGNLLDKATECKDKGLSEDEIFDFCIESLGNYSEPLRQLYKDKIVEILKSDLQKYLLYVASYFLFFIIAYLAVSFITGGWRWSWLILVSSIMVFVGFILSIVFKRAYTLKKIGSTQLYSQVITVLAVVIVYLTVSFFTSFEKTWVLFVWLPAIMLSINMIVCKYVLSKKIKLISLLVNNILISVGLFITLAIYFIGFTYSWILILIAILINLIILSYKKSIKG